MCFGSYLKIYIEPFVGGGAILFHVLQNYNFKEDSIQILSTPITNKEMQNNFNVSLGQGTTKISVNYLPKLMEFFNIKSEYIKSIEEEPIDIQQKTLQFIFSRHLFFVEFFSYHIG